MGGGTNRARRFVLVPAALEKVRASKTIQNSLCWSLGRGFINHLVYTSGSTCYWCLFRFHWWLLWSHLGKGRVAARIFRKNKKAKNSEHAVTDEYWRIDHQ